MSENKLNKKELKKQQLNDDTVVWCIKLTRLRWANHAKRMEPDDPALKILVGHLQG